MQYPLHGSVDERQLAQCDITLQPRSDRPWSHTDSFPAVLSLKGNLSLTGRNRRTHQKAAVTRSTHTSSA
eukprot:13482-Eustigmatos_ZCMA.PRE.1